MSDDWVIAMTLVLISFLILWFGASIFFVLKEILGVLKIIKGRLQ
jgi:hypothetical protein